MSERVWRRRARLDYRGRALTEATARVKPRFDAPVGAKVRRQGDAGVRGVRVEDRRIRFCPCVICRVGGGQAMVRSRRGNGRARNLSPILRHLPA